MKFLCPFCLRKGRKALIGSPRQDLETIGMHCPKCRAGVVGVDEKLYAAKDSKIYTQNLDSAEKIAVKDISEEKKSKPTEIGEKDSLLAILQIYHNASSMWMSVCIAVGLGLLAIPLLVFAGSQGPNWKEAYDSARFFQLITPRQLRSFLTSMLVLCASYLALKTFSLGALSTEALFRLRVREKETTLMDYHMTIKKELRWYYPIFKKMKMGDVTKREVLKRTYKRQLWLLSLIGPLVLSVILFSLIWWKAGYLMFWFPQKGNYFYVNMLLS